MYGIFAALTSTAQTCPSHQIVDYFSEALAGTDCGAIASMVAQSRAIFPVTRHDFSPRSLLYPKRDGTRYDRSRWKQRVRIEGAERDGFRWRIFLNHVPLGRPQAVTCSTPTH